MELSPHNSAGNSYTAAQSREAATPNQPGIVEQIIDLSHEVFPAIMGDIASKSLEIVGKSVVNAIDDAMTEHEVTQAAHTESRAAAIDSANSTSPALSENLMPVATGSATGYENLPDANAVLANVAGNFAASTGADITKRGSAETEPQLNTAA